jgi:hypothetical protein
VDCTGGTILKIVPPSFFAPPDKAEAKKAKKAKKA